MNGPEENKFDQILKSKLNGHHIVPPRNLLPGILDSIEDSSAGGDGSTLWKWTSLSGVLLLLVAGYFIINSFGNGQKTAVFNNGTDQFKEESNFLYSESVLGTKSDISTEEFYETNEGSALSVSDLITSKNSKTLGNKRQSSVKNNTANQNFKSIKDLENLIISSTDNRERIEATFNSNKEIDTEKKPSLSIIDEVVSTTSKGSEDKELFEYEIAPLSAESTNSNSKEATLNDSDDMISNKGLMPTLESHNYSVVATSAVGKEIDTESNNDEKNLTDEVKYLKSSEESISENAVQLNDDLEQPNTDENTDDISVIENTAITDNQVINSDIINTLDSSAFTAQENNWSLDILAGPSLSYRTFNVAGNQDLEDHKNNSETSLVTFSYNLQVMRRITQRWKGHIGLMYLRMGEKYSFSNAIASHSATNQYDYISIPVGVDYNFFKKGKIEMLVGVGAQYNFLQKGTSSWLDPHNYSAQTHTNEGEASPFRDQTLAWNANIELRYRLYDRIDLILKEEGIFFNNSIYKKETGIDQREYSFETFLGFGYRF